MWNHSGMRILFPYLLIYYLLIQQFCVHCVYSKNPKREIAAYSLIQNLFIDLLGKSISRSKMQLIL